MQLGHLAEQPVEEAYHLQVVVLLVLQEVLFLPSLQADLQEVDPSLKVHNRFLLNIRN